MSVVAVSENMGSLGIVMRDLSLVAQARAVLVANRVTRSRSITVDCADGVVSLGGRVEEWSVRSAAEQALAGCRGSGRFAFCRLPPSTVRARKKAAATSTARRTDGAVTARAGERRSAP